MLNKVESKAFCLIDCLPLTECLQPLTFNRNVASHVIFYRYFHMNCSSELTNCMRLPSSNLAAHEFLLTFIHILSTHLMHELTSIFTLSSLLLVNSGTLYLNLCFLLPTTGINLREEYQYTCNLNMASLFFIKQFCLEKKIYLRNVTIFDFVAGSTSCYRLDRSIISDGSYIVISISSFPAGVSSRWFI